MRDFKNGEILYIDKPMGWTSFKVVGRMRWMLSRKIGVKRLKVGHAGTLDPLATGVLVVCTGKATKKIESLQTGVKEYVAEIRLGATTPSYDSEHEVDQTYPWEHITRESLEEVLKTFEGDIEQVPPAYSACKIGGRRAYQLVRDGEEVALRSKQVRIDSIQLIECELPVIKIKVVCGKGTYIRSLARDIGLALESGGYITSLRRTRVGEATEDDCMTMDEFEEWLEKVEINSVKE